MKGVILAGGRGRRLGLGPKALVRVGQERMIDRVIEALRPAVEEILVVTKRPQDFSSLASEVTLLAEPEEPRAALLGLWTGLDACRNQEALVVGSDLPFLQTSCLLRIFERLEPGTVAAIPQIENRWQTLHAAYRASPELIQALRESLDRGHYSLESTLRPLPVVRISEPSVRLTPTERLSFFNVNTPEDLERAHDLAKKA